MKLTVVLEHILLGIWLILRHVMMDDISQSRCQSTSEVCEEPSVGVATSSSWALVPYDENKLAVPDFYLAERRLQFGEFTVTVTQNWQEVGVAAVLWDAAVVLSKYLEQHRTQVRNKTVLELGAGTGLVGIFTAMIGADVTLTDRPIALPVLCQNAAINAVGNVQVRELIWGQKNLDQFSPAYDVIIGADIVYIEETFEDLLDTVDQLSDDRTMVLLSCQIRYDRDLTFIEMLRKRFTVELVHRNQNVKVFAARKL